ncbi:MAG: small multi-drug export protein [Dehalococcoidia bacterium]|jgi:uncharacterized membrane protein|nr:small multi-drug export protein [Dehalococcoidia bacterium]
MRDVLLVILATVTPVSELRGAIPLGIGLGLDPVLTFAVAVITNAVLFLPTRFVLEFFYSSVLRRLPRFDRYLLGVRKRGQPVVEKYGLLGLALFVAVPLPLTGAYTGTILSWLLAMEWKRSFIAVVLGVLVAGIVVMLATLGVVSLVPGA